MKNLCALLSLLLMAAAGTAQSPSKILERANKALGGDKRLKAVASWQQSGSITRLSDGVSGKYFAAAAKGSFGGNFDISGFEYALGYNGRSGWIRDSRNGLRTVTGDAARDLQAEAMYRNSRWLRAKDEKWKLTAGGTSETGGRATNVVLLTSAKGSRLTLHFDAQTGLLSKEHIPAGDVVRTFEYSDYRPVDGIQTPHSIRLADGDERYEIRIEAVRYNGPSSAASFDFPRMSDEPLPDIAELLGQIRANADRVDAILENYSYAEKRIRRDLNKNGEFVIKGSEKQLLTFYKGFRITRTIEKNDKPLSASEQAKEDRDVEKQVSEIEKKIAERERKLVRDRETGAGRVGQPSGEGQRITIADALKGSLLVNPRRERFKGRDVIVFDYEPDPEFKPRTRNEKLFALCNGAVWVDVATSQVVRLEAVLGKSAGNFLAKAKRGASFTLDNEFINNEIWLPSRADINLSIKILFAGIDINNVVEYGDYKRFETEVKDVVVGSEKQP